MEFKGTKGKTKLFEDCFKNNHGFYVQSISTKSSKKILFANAYGQTEEETKANAQLIATAPEILDCLLEIVCAFENNALTNLDYAKQLIQKATTI